MISLIKYFCVLILFAFLVSKSRSTRAVKKICYLPNECRFDMVHNIYRLYGRNFLFDGEQLAFVCEPKTQSYAFDYEQWLQAQHTIPNFWSCYHNGFRNLVDLRYPPHQNLFVSNDVLLNFVKFLLFLNSRFFSFQIFNSGGSILGHDLEKYSQIYYNITENYEFDIKFIHSRMDFLVNGKVAHSCQDLIVANSSSTLIFRLVPNNTLGSYLFLNCEYR